MTEELSTVLVIDDDPSIRRSLTDLFQSIGLRVEVFESARAFLARMRPDGPCCLVLDIRLPGKSGLDFQRELNEASIFLPIIFLTGHGDIPMSVRAMKAGAIEFLPKPFQKEDLLGAVRQAIEVDRARRAETSEVAAPRTDVAAFHARGAG